MNRIALTLSAATLAFGLSGAQALAQQAIEAGPIWNQQHAEQVCPAIAAAHNGEWTGHWWTTVQGQMSVCQIRARARTVEAGPIWNQAHAEQVCPAVAHSHGAEWTGHWWTTVQGEMSVCQIR